MMLQLSGQVWNVFQTEVRKNKEGESYGGDWKVQLMADVPLENGTFRTELVDLKTADHSIFNQNKGKPVFVPVGAFAPSKGSIVFFQVGKPVFPKAVA